MMSCYSLLAGLNKAAQTFCTGTIFCYVSYVFSKLYVYMLQNCFVCIQIQAAHCIPSNFSKTLSLAFTVSNIFLYLLLLPFRNIVYNKFLFFKFCSNMQSIVPKTRAILVRQSLFTLLHRDHRCVIICPTILFKFLAAVCISWHFVLYFVPTSTTLQF